MMATRRSECLCTQRAYAAPSATLFSRQKPCEPVPTGSPGAGTGPFGPAWWPGGRTAQNTFSAEPATTRSTASTTAPAAHSAAEKELWHTSVSPSMVPSAPLGEVFQSGMRSQMRWILRTYGYSCTRRTSAIVAGRTSETMSTFSNSPERRMPRVGCSSVCSRSTFSGGGSGDAREMGGHVWCMKHSSGAMMTGGGAGGAASIADGSSPRSSAAICGSPRATAMSSAVFPILHVACTSSASAAIRALAHAWSRPMTAACRAVCPALFGFPGLAPRAINAFAAAPCPPWHAWNSGVQPYLSLALIGSGASGSSGAPASGYSLSRRSTTGTSPAPAARCSADFP
mmetsp:Transcript_13231/g.55585  ORF Transcript_13231/g.55585 Transcript_13231/m.55585 type:complete len:342 (+) Transcript_13231:980-2005(+)